MDKDQENKIKELQEQLNTYIAMTDSFKEDRNQPSAHRRLIEKICSMQGNLNMQILIIEHYQDAVVGLEETEVSKLKKRIEAVRKTGLPRTIFERQRERYIIGSSINEENDLWECKFRYRRKDDSKLKPGRAITRTNDEDKIRKGLEEEMLPGGIKPGSLHINQVVELKI